MTKRIRAKLALWRGQVKMHISSERRDYYAVKEYGVINDKIKDQWTCTCESSAAYLKECHHIMACRISKRMNHEKL